MNSIEFGTIDPRELKIDVSELSRRLMTPEPLNLDMVVSSMERIIKTARPRYCYAKTSVLSNDLFDISMDFCKINSVSLFNWLKGCSEAVVMAVTLGLEVDLLINSMGALSGAQAFITDAISSAMAETAAEYTQNIIREDYNTISRFSPGYGDFTLKYQRPILDFLSADKLLGIKLGDNLIMTPRKTITAICGVEKENAK